MCCVEPRSWPKPGRVVTTTVRPWARRRAKASQPKVPAPARCKSSITSTTGRPWPMRPEPRTATRAANTRARPASASDTTVAVTPVTGPSSGASVPASSARTAAAASTPITRRWSAQRVGDRLQRQVSAERIAAAPQYQGIRPDTV